MTVYSDEDCVKSEMHIAVVNEEVVFFWEEL